MRPHNNITHDEFGGDPSTTIGITAANQDIFADAVGGGELSTGADARAVAVGNVYGAEEGRRTAQRAVGPVDQRIVRDAEATHLQLPGE